MNVLLVTKVGETEAQVGLAPLARIGLQRSRAVIMYYGRSSE